MKILAIFILILCCSVCILYYQQSFAGIQERTGYGKPIKYAKIMEKYIDGEEILTVRGSVRKILVRAINLRHSNSNNAIAVANKKLYIFSSNGRLLNSSSEKFSEFDVQQIRLADFNKSGYKDSMVIAYHTCGPDFYVFDRFDNYVSTIPLKDSEYQNIPSFYVKDINADGIDEIINSNVAYQTSDGGFTWDVLYENEELAPSAHPGNMQARTSGNPDFGENVCVRYYNSIIALDKNGKAVFETKVPGPGPDYYWYSADFQYAAGDFKGVGAKEEIVTVGDGKSKLYIIDKKGQITDVISLEIKSRNKDLYIDIIRVGKVSSGNKKDDIIAGVSYYLDSEAQNGKRGFGVVSYDPNGIKLWEYLTPNPVTHIFIRDLNADGIPEIVLGTGDKDTGYVSNNVNKITILTNRGKFINELIVNGELLGLGWGSYNPAMDISDINNDGHPEIIAVTSAGKLYVFGQKD